jgi:diguanylate cyclase (GGDEF)-like protein
MDITTMMLALALGNLTLCAALFFFESAKPPALATWNIAKQCQAVGWLLLYFTASGLVPEMVAIVVGYPVLLTGVALESGALWELAGRSAWRRITYTSLALAIAGFLACHAVGLPGLRVVAASLILGAGYLSGAAALAMGWRGGSMLRRFLVLAAVPLALLVGARGVLALTMPGGVGWLSDAMLQHLSTTALYLLMLLSGFGYLLLTREQMQAELERLATIDPLTNVPNRRGLFEKLAPWMALARRPGQPTALVLIDLDLFKRVNDSYGHPAGDAVVREVIEVCKKQLRDSDQLGRLVGVEFAVLLPRTGMAEALLVAERIRAAIAGSAIKTERAMISMTASLGVTTIRADDSTVSLFKRADEALQQAKQQGRNRVVEAPPAPAVL